MQEVIHTEIKVWPKLKETRAFLHKSHRRNCLYYCIILLLRAHARRDLYADENVMRLF